MHFSKFAVRFHKVILAAALLLCLPAAWAMAVTRVNYDMLSYLPETLDTSVGSKALLEEFGKGAFSFLVVENMDDGQCQELADQIEDVNHVESVLSFSSLEDLSIPKDVLPDSVVSAFSDGNATLMAVFFDTSSSADETMEAITSIRHLADGQVLVAGASAMVTDLKNLAASQEPVYVAIAVALALLAMELLLDNWLIPLVFLVSIGMCILYNMGTNLFLGQISYITKALAAVLQLAVTMDYSIFLWNAFKEQKQSGLDSREAMEKAIHETMSSIVGSSITTVAGFLALCFMSFTLGKDLGIVMAKGVIIGVLGCLTILPALILTFEKWLVKAAHKSLLPSFQRLPMWIVSHSGILVLVMVLLAGPAFYFNEKCSQSVYYNIGDSMPDTMPFKTADKALEDRFGLASAHLVLVGSDVPQSTVRTMAQEMEQLDGVETVFSLDSLLPENVPEDIVPDAIKDKLVSENYKLMAVISQYENATDAVNAQIEDIEEIVKAQDPNALVIGEAPLSRDLITTTDHDFAMVNLISIGAIFLIIFFVEQSLSLPFILIGIIELAIALNMSAAWFGHEAVSFITPICISTIQLGATVDYAILMTTRFKKERNAGLDASQAASAALQACMPSILVSGSGLFAATFGVALYSQINIISGMCLLMARGALISMGCVIFFLPGLLRLLDPLICKTTLHMHTERKVC